MTLPLSYSRSFNSKIEAQNPKLRNGFRTSIIDFETGGQGRIRTPVARKERQIYSLLPLPTRPPVRIQISKSQREMRVLFSLQSSSLSRCARKA